MDGSLEPLKDWLSSIAGTPWWINNEGSQTRQRTLSPVDVAFATADDGRGAELWLIGRSPHHVRLSSISFLTHHEEENE